MITAADIKPNARIRIQDGTVFKIVRVCDTDVGILVTTSMEGGEEGRYRDMLEDLIQFFNEQKAKAYETV
jgi:hypothetical protein